MELIVLDTSLKMLSVLDTFESLIWTERYSAYGDFEVYTSINDSVLEILKDDYYLWLKESDQTMIVEDRKIESDAENGNHFTVTGRSLESILERRIIWKQTILSGNFQNGIKKLLDENIINPSDASRKVEGLIFEASTDPAITALTVDAQFTGDNLYDAIKSYAILRTSVSELSCPMIINLFLNSMQVQTVLTISSRIPMSSFLQNLRM